MHDENKWLLPRDLTEAAEIRLFCIPHAGSGASGFYRWRANMRGLAAICAFHLPGRESRLAEPPITDFGVLLQYLKRAIEPHLDRPYLLFGHSMGASLAFELAKALEQDGLRAPLCLIVSARDFSDSVLGKSRFVDLNDAELLTALDEVYDGNLSETLVDPEIRSIYLSILRADLQIVESYRHLESTILLQCPLEVLGAERDVSTTFEGLERWRHATASPRFSLTMFSGTHFYLLGSERQTFLDHLKRCCIQYGRSTS